MITKESLEKKFFQGNDEELIDAIKLCLFDNFSSDAKIDKIEVKKFKIEELISKIPNTKGQKFDISLEGIISHGDNKYDLKYSFEHSCIRKQERRYIYINNISPERSSLTKI